MLRIGRTIQLGAMLVVGFALLSACHHTSKPLDNPPTAGNNPNNAGLEYAPDMYHSIPLEGYSQYKNEDFTPGGYNTYFLASQGNGGNAQAPVNGTIARNRMEFYFPYDSSAAGYEAAGLEYKSPIPADAANIAEGKRLFTLFCQHCHGEKGDGNGSIPTAGKFPNPPAYNGDQLKDLPEGKAFFSLTYGKNLMGSHAAQLTPTERWQVIRYVQTLQKPAVAAPVATDSTKKAAATPAATPAAGGSTTTKTTAQAGH
jgi:mono/diheme cytochrome c family protein